MDQDQKVRLVKQYSVKYSKQIGILDVEIPELYFDAQEFKTKIHESIIKRGIELENDVLDTGYFKGIYGHCGRRYGRFLYVNIGRFNDDDIHNSNLRRLLIHELVHYRFPRLQHGHEFFTTIELIYIGREYPRHHIACPNVPFI
jgi:hypothetical protein